MMFQKPTDNTRLDGSVTASGASMMSRRRRASLVFVFNSLVFALAAQERIEAFTGIPDETKKLHSLFDDEWQWTLREYPELATRIGDPRYNDKLTDLTPAAIDKRKAHKRDLLKRIREIDRAGLRSQDVVSYNLFQRETEQSIALQRFPSEWMPISQMSGVHISIPELPRVAPLRTVNNYDDFLTRLEAYPRHVDQVIELMKRGIAAGWVPPRYRCAKFHRSSPSSWHKTSRRAHSTSHSRAFRRRLVRLIDRGWKPEP